MGPDPAAARAEPAATLAAVTPERAGAGDIVAAGGRRARSFQAGSAGASAAAEPARTARGRTRVGGAALSRAAAARARRRCAGGDLRRDLGGVARSLPRRAVGTRCPGGGTGGRVDPGDKPGNRA